MKATIYQMKDDGVHTVAEVSASGGKLRVKKHDLDGLELSFLFPKQVRISWSGETFTISHGEDYLRALEVHLRGDRLWAVASDGVFEGGEEYP